MARGDMTVKLGIEPIVKVVCMAMHCRHNASQRGHGGAYRCDYKHIKVSWTGQCESYESIDEETPAIQDN